MKAITSTVLVFVLFLAGNMVLGQTRYVNSADGVNLRSGAGTNHSVITTIPHNAEVRVISTEGSWTQVEYNGRRGYVSSRFLDDKKNSTARSSSSNTSGSSNRNTSRSSSAGGSDYRTSLGLRGGFTSGITFKHFVRDQQALEFVLGSRWHGFSITGLYEWHKPNALGVAGLSWEYGIGAQIGFFNGRYYYDHYPRNCNDPSNPKCYSYWRDRSFTAIGLAGIGGLEYRFREIPFTISLDLIPYFYFNHWAGNVIDGSVSVRYIIK
jgi:hypothetical protein